MRVPLTKKMVNTLQVARKGAGLSQYVLADRLGWKRSKIKRLEKGEVGTIEDADYRAFLGCCVENGANRREIRKEATRTAAVKRPGGAELRGAVSSYFTKVRMLPSRGKSCLEFVRVTLTKDLPDHMDVLEKRVHVKASRLEKWTSRTVIGLEFAQEQLPLKKGMTVDLALHPK